MLEILAREITSQYLGWPSVPKSRPRRPLSLGPSHASSWSLLQPDAAQTLCAFPRMPPASRPGSSPVSGKPGALNPGGQGSALLFQPLGTAPPHRWAGIGAGRRWGQPPVAQTVSFFPACPEGGAWGWREGESSGSGSELHRPPPPRSLGPSGKSLYPRAAVFWPVPTESGRVTPRALNEQSQWRRALQGVEASSAVHVCWSRG